MSAATEDVGITIVGPGFGEACVARLPGRLYLVIDSCRADNGLPVAFRVLGELGYRKGIDRLIVAITHWHSDHISGMADLLEGLDPEFVVLPVAFTTKRFLAFAGALADIRNTKFEQPTREFVKLLDVLKRRRLRLKHASIDSLLLRDPASAVEIYALSPTDRGVESFLERIAALMPAELQPPPAVPSLTENSSSVVLLVKLGGWSAVFGADLEEDTLRSWTEITEHSTSLDRDRMVHFFKIPHHGSRNGYCKAFHDAVLAADPVFVVTPYNRGSNPPPTEEDVIRMQAYPGRVFITSRVSERTTNLKKTFGFETERFLKDFGVTLRERDSREGSVSVRSPRGTFDPRVSLGGAAKVL